MSSHAIRQRLSPEARTAVILRAGVAVANRLGYVCGVTHAAVAEACEIQTSIGTVRQYFRTNDALHRAISNAPDLAHNVERVGVVSELL